MIKQIEMGLAGIILAAAVLLTGVVTWGIASFIHDKEVLSLQKEHSDQLTKHEADMRAIAVKAQEQTQAAIDRMKEAQNALAELDQKRLKELSDAKAENDSLRRDVIAGSRSVRLIAETVSRCDTGSSTASGGSSTGSVGDGKGIELTPNSAKLIFDLREGIINDQAKLKYLQSYARDIVKQCKRS